LVPILGAWLANWDFEHSSKMSSWLVYLVAQIWMLDGQSKWTWEWAPSMATCARFSSMHTLCILQTPKVLVYLIHFHVHMQSDLSDLVL
jgi:hypothetical protein